MLTHLDWDAYRISCYEKMIVSVCMGTEVLYLYSMISQWLKTMPVWPPHRAPRYFGTAWRKTRRPRPSFSRFAKKPSSFTGINPQSTVNQTLELPASFLCLPHGPCRAAATPRLVAGPCHRGRSRPRWASTRRNRKRRTASLCATSARRSSGSRWSPRSAAEEGAPLSVVLPLAYAKWPR